VIGDGPGISNVTLSYEWTEWTINNEASESVVEHPWKTALMLLIAPEGDEYAYTIPSSEVAGNIDYFISAYDKGGSSVGTPIHTIQVSDFQIEAETDTIIVHLGEEKSIDVFIRSINDFQSPVELRTEKTPYGIQASINPSKVTPPKGGESKVTFRISASDAPGTFRGQFDLLLYGKSGSTEHKALIEQIVVPYYEVSISPTSVTINKEQTASYNIKITPSQDFSKEISFSISGLPSEEINWEINLKNKKFAVASEANLILEISTTKKTETGTYNLTLNIEGGGIKNQIALSLTIK